MLTNFKFELRSVLRAPAMIGFVVAFCVLLLVPNLSRLHPQIGYAQEADSYAGDMEQISAQLDDWQHNPPAVKPTNPSAADLQRLNAQLATITGEMIAPHVDSRRVMRAKLVYDESLLRGARAGWSKFAPTVNLATANVRTFQYLLRHHIKEIPAGTTNLPALNQMSQSITSQLPIQVLLVFIGLWCATLLIDDKRHRVNDLVTLLPLRKTTVLLNKLGSFLIVGLTGMVLAFGMSYAVPALLTGAGHFDYPVPYSIDGQHILIKHVGTLVCQQVACLLLLMLVFALCSVLIQLFTRNILVSFLGILLLAIEGTASTTPGRPTSVFSVNTLLTSIDAGQSFVMIAATLAGIGVGLLLLCWLIVHQRQRL